MMISPFLRLHRQNNCESLLHAFPKPFMGWGEAGPNFVDAIFSCRAFSPSNIPFGFVSVTVPGLTKKVSHVPHSLGFRSGLSDIERLSFKNDSINNGDKVK